VNSRKDYLHTVIIGPNGSERMHEIERRIGYNNYFPLPLPLKPIARQVVADDHNDRVMFRVIEPTEPYGPLGLPSRQEVWRLYEMSTGATVTRIVPPLGYILRTEFVKGTPLVLAQGLYECWLGGAERMCGRFSLIDAKGELIWDWEATDDYGSAHAGHGQRLWDSLADDHAILNLRAEGTFALHLRHDKTRVKFRVERDDLRGQWRVTEIGRSILEEVGDAKDAG
jgi:hypothetical protein